ncbi:hypothetical protein [Pedobacter sp.]
MRFRLLSALSLLFINVQIFAQTSTLFNVGGDIEKFYPVVFLDADWVIDKPTEIIIGRSDVHRNSSWRGALIAKFVYHTTNWGHGASFIDADIKSSVQPFVGGWVDATGENGESKIIIWLRGGNTTYRLNSPSTVSYQVNDGIQFPLPYNETNGTPRMSKTTIDDYVQANLTIISSAMSMRSNLYVIGNVGIGTTTPAEKLSVNGKIRAKEVKVEVANWPDYVFEDSYRPKTLSEIESFIKLNKHLPDVPSAKQVEANGIELGEMNKVLLKKIEELTLLLIEQNRKNEQQDKLIEQLLKKSN